MKLTIPAFTLGTLLLAALPIRAQILVSYSQGLSNDVTVSNNDLLQTSLSSTDSVDSTGTFSFEQTGTIAVLTDGTAGPTNTQSLTLNPYRVTVSSGSTITYNLNLTASPLGYSLSDIDITTGWADSGRVDPNVSVLYSTIADPTTFVPLATADYSFDNSQNPQNLYNSWTKSAITNSVAGVPVNVANGVAAVKFSFGTQENGYVGYSEIDVVGSPTATTPEPSVRVLMLGGVAALLVGLRFRQRLN